jgi:hypothetical protein
MCAAFFMGICSVPIAIAVDRAASDICVIKDGDIS